MPCDSGMSASHFDWGARAEIDRLTRISCDIIRAVEHAGVPLDLSKEAGDWWEKHKAIDAERERAEAEKRRRDQIRQGALAKLSDEERRALGI